MSEPVRKPVAAFVWEGYPYVVCDDGATFAFDRQGKWYRTSHPIPGTAAASHKEEAP
jgi:hypothetical protein